ncbi:hypothetical protein C2G38_2129488, partial [Gigaspora rosea]
MGSCIAIVATKPNHNVRSLYCYYSCGPYKKKSKFYSDIVQIIILKNKHFLYSNKIRTKSEKIL